MVRSFSYAAFAGLERFRAAHPDREAVTDNLASWASSWETFASGEFLRAYRETMAASPELLPSAERAQDLLAAYALEKALYELLYELNNRPSWLHIPLGGILTL